jgi:hypothetical protein
MNAEWKCLLLFIIVWRQKICFKSSAVEAAMPQDYYYLKGFQVFLPQRNCRLSPKAVMFVVPTILMSSLALTILVVRSVQWTRPPGCASTRNVNNPNNQEHVFVVLFCSVTILMLQVGGIPP